MSGARAMVAGGLPLLFETNDNIATDEQEKASLAQFATKPPPVLTSQEQAQQKAFNDSADASIRTGTPMISASATYGRETPSGTIPVPVAKPTETPGSTPPAAAPTSFAKFTPAMEGPTNAAPGDKSKVNYAKPASFRLEGGRQDQLAEMSSDDPAGAVKIENMAKSLQERGINSIADLEKYSAAPSGPPGLNAQEIIASNEARKDRARRAEAYNMAKQEFMSAGTDRPEARREALRTMAALSGVDPASVKGKTGLNPLEESQRLENEANTQKLNAANRAEGIALANKAFANAGGGQAELYSSVVSSLSDKYKLPLETVASIIMVPALEADAKLGKGPVSPEAFGIWNKDGSALVEDYLKSQQQVR